MVAEKRSLFHLCEEVVREIPAPNFGPFSEEKFNDPRAHFFELSLQLAQFKQLIAEVKPDQPPEEEQFVKLCKLRHWLSDRGVSLDC